MSRPHEQLIDLARARRDRGQAFATAPSAPVHAADQSDMMLLVSAASRIRLRAGAPPDAAIPASTLRFPTPIDQNHAAALRRAA